MKWHRLSLVLLAAQWQSSQSFIRQSGTGDQFSREGSRENAKIWSAPDLALIRVPVYIPSICVWYAHWLAGRIANTELIAWNLFSLRLRSVFFHQMVCFQIYFWFTGEQKSWIIDHLCCVCWYHLINGSLSLFYPAIANSYLIQPSAYRATNRCHHNANLLCIYPCDFAASPECHQLIWSSPRRICRPGDCLP